jgi:hypothetical protein
MIIAFKPMLYFLIDLDNAAFSITDSFNIFNLGNRLGFYL